MFELIKGQSYQPNHNLWVNKCLTVILSLLLIITANAAQSLKFSLDSTYTPAITKLQAVNIAKNHYGIKNITQIKNPDVKLVIKTHNQATKLVYMVSFMTPKEQIRHPFFVIDATNGDLLDQWEELV